MLTVSYLLLLVLVSLGRPDETLLFDTSVFNWSKIIKKKLSNKKLDDSCLPSRTVAARGQR